MSQQFENLDTYLGQLQHYKKMQEHKFKKSKPWGARKVITVADLQKQIDEETNARNRAQGAGKS